MLLANMGEMVVREIEKEKLLQVQPMYCSLHCILYC